MASKSTARRRAKASAQGQRQLPKATTSRARKAATFIGPIPEPDREKVIKVKIANWWNTGESLQDYRKEGSIDSVYDYAQELESAGVPGNLINITQGSNSGLYFIYAARDSG